MTDDRKIEIMMMATKAVNPLVRFLLRTPVLHGMVSKDIVLLHFQGRKSGRWFSTPVTYVEDQGVLTILTDSPWWRNLRDRPNIRVTLRGQETDATATVEADDRDKIAAAITKILAAVPRDAAFYNVEMEDGQPNPAQVEKAAERAVLIEARLG